MFGAELEGRCYASHRMRCGLPSQIRTNAFVTHGLYGNDNSHAKEISNGNGANGRART